MQEDVAQEGPARGGEPRLLARVMAQAIAEVVRIMIKHFQIANFYSFEDCHHGCTLCDKP